MGKHLFRLAYKQANGNVIPCHVQKYKLMRWRNRTEAQKFCDGINDERRKKINRDVGLYIVEEVPL